MNIDNITSKEMTLNYEGRMMQIKVYEKEIERLSNIINEFDKWLEVNLTNLEKRKTSNIYNEGLKQGMLTNGRLIKDKLQELKGSDKE